MVWLGLESWSDTFQFVSTTFSNLKTKSSTFSSLPGESSDQKLRQAMPEVRQSLWDLVQPVLSDLADPLVVRQASSERHTPIGCPTSFVGPGPTSLVGPGLLIGQEQ